MKQAISKEQYNDLCYLQQTDIQAFNKKLEELFDIDVVSCTLYQYFYGSTYIGDSDNDMTRDILNSLGVEIKK